MKPVESPLEHVLLGEDARVALLELPVLDCQLPYLNQTKSHFQPSKVILSKSKVIHNLSESQSQPVESQPNPSRSNLNPLYLQTVKSQRTCIRPTEVNLYPLNVAVRKSISTSISEWRCAK